MRPHLADDRRDAARRRRRGRRGRTRRGRRRAPRRPGGRRPGHPGVAVGQRPPGSRPARNRWSSTPRAAMAAASSPSRCSPSASSRPDARCARSGTGMTSPSSPQRAGDQRDAAPLCGVPGHRGAGGERLVVGVGVHEQDRRGVPPAGSCCRSARLQRRGVAPGTLGHVSDDAVGRRLGRLARRLPGDADTLRAGELRHADRSGKWQATGCPGASSTQLRHLAARTVLGLPAAGAEHAARRRVDRGGQVAAAAGSGRAALRPSGSGTGTADSRACVYGCSGGA